MKKSITLTAVLLLMLLLVAACGTQPTIDTSIVDEANAKAATAEAAGSTEESPAAEPVTLKVWSMYAEGETFQKWGQQAIDAFEAENPNVKVDVQWVGRDVVGVKLRNAVISGDELPDIIDLADVELKTSVIDEGMALPLDDYLNTPAYDDSTPWGETFIPSIMEYLKFGGEHAYLIPRMVYSSGFFYNKNIFAENNIEIPRTWDEFIAVCEQLKAAGITPVLTDHETTYTIWPFTVAATHTAGPDQLKAAFVDKTGESWSNPDLVRGAELASQLTHYYQDGYEGSVWPAAQLEFVQGRGAMMFMGAWLPSEMAQQTPEGFEMDIFPFPAVNDGKGNGVNEAWTNSWLVLNSTKHPDEAVDLLKFFTSKAQMKKVVENGAPAPLVGFELPKSLQGLADIFGEATQLVGRQGGLEAIDSHLLIDVLEQTAYDPLFIGKSTPEETMKAMQKAQADYYQSKP